MWSPPEWILSKSHGTRLRNSAGEPGAIASHFSLDDAYYGSVFFRHALSNYPSLYRLPSGHSDLDLSVRGAEETIMIDYAIGHNGRLQECDPAVGYEVLWRYVDLLNNRSQSTAKVKLQTDWDSDIMEGNDSHERALVYTDSPLLSTELNQMYCEGLAQQSFLPKGQTRYSYYTFCTKEVSEGVRRLYYSDYAGMERGPITQRLGGQRSTLTVDAPTDIVAVTSNESWCSDASSTTGVVAANVTRVFLNGTRPRPFSADVFSFGHGDEKRLVFVMGLSPGSVRSGYAVDGLKIGIVVAVCVLLTGISVCIRRVSAPKPSTTAVIPFSSPQKGPRAFSTGEAI